MGMPRVEGSRRRISQAARPSKSGNIKSRMIKSGSASWEQRRPSLPFAAVITRWAVRRKLYARTSSMSGSSSMIKIVVSITPRAASSRSHSPVDYEELGYGHRVVRLQRGENRDYLPETGGTRGFWVKLLSIAALKSRAAVCNLLAHQGGQVHKASSWSLFSAKATPCFCCRSRGSWDLIKMGRPARASSQRSRVSFSRRSMASCV